jgi:hypothetical protein
MKLKQIPEWLNAWHHEFQTCDEVWRELEAKAISHQLTDEQQDEVLKMMLQYRDLWDETMKLQGPERRRRRQEELFPLDDTIMAYCKEKGFPDLVIVKDGKKGLKSIDGKVIMPPEYEDINFTFDDDIFNRYYFGFSFFVVKRDGKWGVVNQEQEVLIPFEYDNIYRKPNEWRIFVLTRNGKQGLAYIECMDGRDVVTIPVEVKMDAIYHVTTLQLTLFTIDGKWGWWWWTSPEEAKFYESYCDPKYDAIFVQRQEDMSMDDEDDEYFHALLGDDLHWITFWTIK